TLNGLQRALQNDGQVDALETEAIAEAALADGHFSAGEQALIGQLRQATAQGGRVPLQLKGFDSGSLASEISFNLRQGQVSPESPQSFVQGLSAFTPRLRADFFTSLSRAGLSGPETKQLALALQGTGMPAALGSLVQALKSSRPEQIRSFSAQYLQLSSSEQAAGLDITRLLLQHPAPADLRSRLNGILGAMPTVMSRGAEPTGMALGKTLNSLGLYLPATDARAPGAEDASGRLRQVVMGNYDSPDQQGYIRDMIATARREGFVLTLQIDAGQEIPALKAQLFKDLVHLRPPLARVADLDAVVRIVASNPAGSMWAEDNKWITGEGTVVTVPDADQAIARLNRFISVDTGARPGEIGSEGHHTAGLSTYDPEDLVPHYSTQGAVSGNAEGQDYLPGVVNDANRDEYLNAAALAQGLGRPLRTTRFYNEGGNMLVGSLPNGEAYAVIGRDGLIVSAFHLEAQFQADPDRVPEFAPEREIAQVTRMGLNQPFASLSPDQQCLIDQTSLRLQATGEIYSDQNAGRMRAIQFLARMELSKEVFASDLELPQANLIFVAQPEFHIDMHMRPLAPGQILINDFDANERLLLQAKAKAAPGSWEAHELEGMRARNARLKAVMEPVMRQIETQLRSGGLEVVRAPGVMQAPMHNPSPELAPENRIRHVNFMNAIPATRPGSNQQIYITNHTSLAPLRAAYADYLRKERGIETVHWIGSGGGERNKSAAEQSLDLEGGLDCRENH
ncbi:MAG: hypothetical protein ACAI44_05815, partial [Candidatus Sericytochromatia bacterium]